MLAKRKYVRSSQPFVRPSEVSKEEAKRAYQRWYAATRKEERYAAQKAWRAANPEAVKKSARIGNIRYRKVHADRIYYHHLKVTYGVSGEWYVAQMQRQRGLCALCGDPPKLRQRLAVDHDHQTGKVRGLLCMLCNSAVERLEKVSGWAANAARYLEDHK